MNRPDDFSGENSTRNANESEAQQSADRAENDNMSETAQNRQQENFPPIEEPQWYGVSYHGDTAYYQGNTTNGNPVAPKKPKKRGKIAMLSAVIAVCLIFALSAGFGGAMIARSIQEHRNDPQSGTTFVPSNSVGNSSGSSTVYESEGADTYDYASVVLQKNDGSALAGSKNGSAGDSTMTLQAAVAAVQDSVVEITATATSVRGTVTAGAGSGVIVHGDGIIVTNNHVINGFTDIYVIVTDHTQTDENGNYLQYKYKASVRGADEDGDIAILKINPVSALTVAKLGSSKDIALAEEVFAIGNPLGELGGTVTNGIVSAISREVQVDDVTMTLLQTNAAINSGNSGGGLFNLAGELIGIVNAKYSATGVEGLGFAIPIDTAMHSISDLLNYGYIRGIPAIGVTLADGYVRSGWSSIPVVYVFDAGGHADLRQNDIITKVDETSVSTVSQVRQIIRNHAVGDTLTLTVERDGSTTTVSITLIEYVPA